MLGANDANLPGPLRGVAPSASRQHVPLDEYVANLRAIMSAVEQMGDGSARLLLITPPPCDEKAWHAHCVGTYGVPADADPNRSFATTKAYADAVVRLGRETGTATLDLHSAFEARADWQACFRDGLHPNAAGGMLIGDAVLEAIADSYPELRPGSVGDPELASKLAVDFPDHKEVDADDVTGSFRTYAQAKARAMPPPKAPLGRMKTGAFFK